MIVQVEAVAEYIWFDGSICIQWLETRAVELLRVVDDLFDHWSIQAGAGTSLLPSRKYGGSIYGSSLLPSSVEEMGGAMKLTSY